MSPKNAFTTKRMSLTQTLKVVNQQGRATIIRRCRMLLLTGFQPKNTFVQPTRL